MLKRYECFSLNPEGHTKVTVKSHIRHYKNRLGKYISGCHGDKADKFEPGGSYEKNSIANLSDDGFRYFDGRREPGARGRK